MQNRTFQLLLLACLCWLIGGMNPSPGWSAGPEFRQSKGQTLYVPVYSNVFSGPRSHPFPLATTLSIRSTDLSASFRVTSIDYYDTNGKLLRRYQEKPVPIGPLGSTYVHLEEKDVAGGFGAKFIVRWEADRAINAPIVECVMIGATSGQGISFVSVAQEIKE
jgi:hypothetical protein